MRSLLSSRKATKPAPSYSATSNDFIITYETDPSTTLCAEIIEHSEEEEREWDRSMVLDSNEVNGRRFGLNGTGHPPVTIEGRVELQSRDSYHRSHDARNPPDVHKPMLQFASECLGTYLHAFPQANKFPTFSVIETYQVLRYLDGGAYHAAHGDYHPYGSFNRRHLTGIGFLNDVAKGGEFVFTQQDLTVKSEAGKFIIFPSGWTHAHKTLPCIGQSRYVFQLWWGFDEYGNAG